MSYQHPRKGVPAKRDINAGFSLFHREVFPVVDLMVNHGMSAKGILKRKTPDMHEMPVDKPFKETGINEDDSEREELGEEGHGLSYTISPPQANPMNDVSRLSVRNGEKMKVNFRIALVFRVPLLERVRHILNFLMGVAIIVTGVIDSDAKLVLCFGYG